MVNNAAAAVASTDDDSLAAVLQQQRDKKIALETVDAPDLTDKQRAWLDNQMSDAQLAFFRENGFLIIPDALDADMVARLTEVVDRVCDAVREKKGLAEHKDVSTLRAVMEDPLMLKLLDHPKTFPIMWDVLGWNIQLYISQMLVKPGLPAHYIRPERQASGFHQGECTQPPTAWRLSAALTRPYPNTSRRPLSADGGRPNSETAWDHALPEGEEMREGPGATPMLTAKLAYFLTDTVSSLCRNDGFSLDCQYKIATFQQKITTSTENHNFPSAHAILTTH